MCSSVKKEDEIRVLIDTLRTQENYDEGYISFHQFNDNKEPVDGYIRANRQGLEIYAAQLLDASLITEKKSGTNQLIDYQLDTGIIGSDSLFFFDYVEVDLKNRSDIGVNSDDIVTWKDQAFKAGCLLVGLILVTLIIVGAISVFSWFGDVFNPNMD